MDRSAELLWIFGWRWLFYCNCLWLEGQCAVQGWGCQGRGCVLDLSTQLCGLSSHTQHMAALQARQEVASWSRAGCILPEPGQQWCTGWHTPHGTGQTGLRRANNLKNIFFFLFFFLFLIFFLSFWKKKKKKSSNFLGHCSLYLQQNLFILQEILSAAFFGNMQFCWWETTHKRSALSKEAFQNVSSLN